MNKLDTERTELREFTADVEAGAARNLVLLRDIEGTLAWLERLNGTLRADCGFTERVNEGLKLITGVIDPDGSIQNDIEQAQDKIEELYKLLICKRQHGRNDHQLTEEDGIEDAYTESIAQAADLQNSLNTLRWNIGEHDIDASPRQLSKEYAADDIDAMFNSMLSE